MLVRVARSSWFGHALLVQRCVVVASRRREHDSLFDWQVVRCHFSASRVLLELEFGQSLAARTRKSTRGPTVRAVCRCSL